MLDLSSSHAIFHTLQSKAWTAERLDWSLKGLFCSFARLSCPTYRLPGVEEIYTMDFRFVIRMLLVKAWRTVWNVHVSRPLLLSGLLRGEKYKYFAWYTLNLSIYAAACLISSPSVLSFFYPNCGVSSANFSFCIWWRFRKGNCLAWDSLQKIRCAIQDLFSGLQKVIDDYLKN